MVARDKILTIKDGDYQLDLCPEAGGCMTAFRYRGIDVMRPATDEYWQHNEPRAAASFPLVPFSNRIADGTIVFEGQSYHFPINMPPEPHSIHGDGWKAAWQIEVAEPARAILSHAPTDSAFSYVSRQIFELGDAGLDATLEITNTGERRLPFGFGHHPYFPRTEGLTLDMPVSHVWLPDERKLPASKVRVPDAWDFTGKKRLTPLDLDHDFPRSDGTITMQWPETGLRLSIHAERVFGHVVVFVPPGRDFVCVEPVSHLANAINMTAHDPKDTGLRVLGPGETLKGSIRFTAEIG